MSCIITAVWKPHELFIILFYPRGRINHNHLSNMGPLALHVWSQKRVRSEVLLNLERKELRMGEWRRCLGIRKRKDGVRQEQTTLWWYLKIRGDLKMLQNQHYWTKLYNTEFVQHLMLKSELKTNGWTNTEKFWLIPTTSDYFVIC